MRKILLLLANSIYPNPHNTVFTKVFLKKNKCFFFGPGYNSIYNYDTTFSELLLIENQFDWVITDSYILTDNYLELFKNSWINFNKKKAIPMMMAMKKFFIESKKKKLFYVNFDYHDPPKGIIKNIKNSNTFILTPGLEFTKKISHKDLKLEPAIKKPKKTWYKFLINNSKKIISFPFFLDESEFIRCQKKSIDISIMGVSYFYRKLYKKKITNNANLKIFVDGLRCKILWKLISYAKFIIFINFFRNRFSKIISISKISFTCGSTLDYPVRKFLEIPAKCSLLLCKPFRGYKHFGFKNGINFIIADFNNPNKQIEHLLKNKDKLNKITKMGMSLILRKHSTKVRQSIINLCLNRIESNKFKGSRWFKGVFKIF